LKSHKYDLEKNFACDKYLPWKQSFFFNVSSHQKQMKWKFRAKKFPFPFQ